MIDRWNRGRTMGKDLDRISHGLCAKIPVNVSEGMKRPEAHMQAAKLASETGIILRQHIPILPHWKDYKKDDSHFDNYMGKIAGRFAIDSNSKAVKNACTDLFKGGLRQLRYRLKKAYFDVKPANEVRTTSPLDSMTDEQWWALVEMWSNPKHKEKCAKNKSNREKVVMQQRTGSRCFVAHCHAVKQDKYKDVPATPIDLFKECYCSSKTGFTEPVKKAIADMEAMMTEHPEGQDPKSPNEIFSEVLPRSKFLQTAGIVAAAPKRNGKAAVSSRVQELESELEAEKRGAAALRDQLDAQQLEMGDLKKHVQDSDAQIEALKKQAAETDIILRKLLMLNKV
ncbi:hypothetical protein EJB05_13468 [Eragrostis curvula]|uniref:Uncharacterized protein n=1 Tax=Eragrostis curvula TaxID=38414 RepID=A0A5J9VWC6_9POAL|nr:hypothetical protein EJB05_13468 [Eragrostis curvula]